MEAFDGSEEFPQNDDLVEKSTSSGVDPFLATGLIFLVLAGGGWMFVRFFRYFDAHITLALVLGGISILSGLVGAICCFLGLGRSK